MLLNLSGHNMRGEEEGIKSFLRQRFISHGDDNIPARWNKGIPLFTGLAADRGRATAQSLGYRSSITPDRPDNTLTVSWVQQRSVAIMGTSCTTT